MNCKICKNQGWVCENHPDKAWNDGKNCCGGAGQPCHYCDLNVYKKPKK